MISLRHISKEFKVYQQKKGAKHFVKNLLRPDVRTITAVNDLSFDIGPGELVGFIGENGAGKSTTIKMMCGILFPSRGEILVNGRVPYKQRRQTAAHIGVVFGQRSRLVWDLPMTDTFDLYKEIYRIDGIQYRRNVERFTDMLAMGDYIQTPIRQLSLGQRMKAEIALAMLHDPGTLFLDEPTIGLDVMAKRAIREFIRERNRQSGTTVLLTSHDMKDLDTVCNRIILMKKGSLFFDGDIEAFKRTYSERTTVDVVFRAPPVLSGIEKPSIQLLDQKESLCSFSFDSSAYTLIEVLALLAPFGDVIDVRVKQQDIEDIVRGIFARQ